MNPNTDDARVDALVTSLGERFAALTRTLSAWVLAAPHDLAELEQHVLHCVKDLGADLLAGLAALRAPTQPPAAVVCPCGHIARYQRQRPATVTTVLGPITVVRPYYLCRRCGHGHHPLDAQLQLCAGSRSAGLDELLALLGATLDSFAQAAAVLERLTLVHLSPNTVRDSTEALGGVLVAHQAAQAAAAAAGQTPATTATPVAERLYITMDGVLAHLHERGWSEIKVGCCYQTRSKAQRQCSDTGEIRAHSLSYVSAAVEAETFGWHLWQEAARRGVAEVHEVVVVGDGAHWIWNLAATHLPGATEIVDWYHASQYVWTAATAIWGSAEAAREAWAHCQLAALWDGQVELVLAALEAEREAGEAVTAAISYYTTHRQRMNYPVYRARGLQIGSGSVESACKQVVSARLKQAGMIWDVAGAAAVAAVRAWLKSERWAEALALRPAPGRRYERRSAATRDTVPGGTRETGAAAAPPAVAAGRRLPPDVLAQVRAECVPDPAQHPWRKAWSRKRQREQRETGRGQRTTPTA
jgi:hypothetical protein